MKLDRLLVQLGTIGVASHRFKKQSQHYQFPQVLIIYNPLSHSCRIGIFSDCSNAI